MKLAGAVPLDGDDDGPERPAVFIDKDGTLIDDVPYNADPALLRFRPAALAALAALQRAGFALVIVSNQSGLALGRFTLAEFQHLQRVLQQRLRAEAGVRLTDFLFCPHAPAAEGQNGCLCRKPAPGMLLRAANRHRLDLDRSWMVGDTLDDVEAGRRAGCRALLYDSGGETVWRQGPLRKPELRLRAWDDVARCILSSALQERERDAALAAGCV